MFDISIFRSGVAGRTGFDIYTVYNNLMKSRENVGPGVFNGWTPYTYQCTDAPLTLKDNNNEGRTSDYFIVSTSYFKVRNMQLGYNLTPKSSLFEVAIFCYDRKFILVQKQRLFEP